MTEQLDQSVNESLEVLMSEKLSEINTCMPGIIESYDHAKQSATIKPAFKRVYEVEDNEEKIIELPLITGCRPMFFRTGGAFISFPVKAGDPVLLLFSQRSLDAYMETDGKRAIDPEYSGMHEISDAFFIPAMFTAKNIVNKTHENNIVLGFEEGAVFHITPAGELWTDATKTRLGSQDANKALALAEKVDQNFNDFKSKYNNHTTMVMGAPVPILPIDLITLVPGTGSGKVFTNG